MSSPASTMRIREDRFPEMTRLLLQPIKPHSAKNAAFDATSPSGPTARHWLMHGEGLCDDGRHVHAYASLRSLSGKADAKPHSLDIGMADIPAAVRNRHPHWQRHDPPASID
ncbi:hypothetical protein [Burkholderia alba]|uniref:hypothetical protein n=1 Tax=Burkholderia alba TaxID=2683677 RepID=UPI002B059A93|nr:hypothetical protein [Burkholderia alba]